MDTIFNPDPTTPLAAPSAAASSSNSNIINTNNSNSNNNTNNNNINNNSNNNNDVTVTIDTKQMQSELERRQQELEIKAAELAAREEALRQGGEFRRQHNWPPLPSFCPLKPCFFQDINVDIRPEFQRVVQLGYHLWIGFVFTQLLNIFAAILLLSYGVENATNNLGFSITTTIFLVPLTYMSWFRPLYKAFKNDSSFNFMVFFFVFFMQTMIVGLWSLGLPTGGPCGLYVALKNLGVSVLLAIVLFFVTACWVAYTTASTLFILRVHSIYRSSGASIAKAKNEFTQGIISNQYVQQTVAQAARTTASQAFGGPSTSSTAAVNMTA